MNHLHPDHANVEIARRLADADLRRQARSVRDARRAGRRCPDTPSTCPA